ncbi:MAG: hypothetical protein KDE28_29675, partial [Anaerolineales bacterium]|nr:hypothetical protein [Anaerolineales bacterium]
MKKLNAVWLFILFLIGGCRPNGEIVSVASATPAPVSPQLGPFIQDGASYNKSLGNRSYTVPNCSGSQVPLVNSPSFGVNATSGLTWEVNGEAGFGMTIGEGVVPGGVDLSGTLGAAVQSGIEQSFNMQESWELSAGPGEVVTYIIEWVEIWQPGYV